MTPRSSIIKIDLAEKMISFVAFYYERKLIVCLFQKGSRQPVLRRLVRPTSSIVCIYLAHSVVKVNDSTSIYFCMKVSHSQAALKRLIDGAFSR